MNAENLQDALDFLPEDLLVQADACRGRKKPPVPFARYAAMAACFALILTASLFLTRLTQSKGAAEAAPMMQDAAIPEAAPEDEEQRLLTDEAPAEEYEPAEDCANSQTVTGASALLQITHLSTGRSWQPEPADAQVLTELLANLAWDPGTVCNCIAEYRLEGMEESCELNLTEGFARAARGQALLTESQTETIRAILEKTEVTP